MSGKGSSRGRDDRGVPLAERDGSGLSEIREESGLHRMKREPHAGGDVIERAERGADVAARSPQDDVVDPTEMSNARVPDGAIQLGEHGVGEDGGRVGADREAADAAFVDAPKEVDGGR